MSRWHFAAHANRVICPRLHLASPGCWIAPRSVTSAGCSLQKSTFKPRALLGPPLPNMRDAAAGRAYYIYIPARRIRGLSRSLLPCTWLRPSKVSHRPGRETFACHRNLSTGRRLLSEPSVMCLARGETHLGGAVLLFLRSRNRANDTLPRISRGEVRRSPPTSPARTRQ